MNYTAHLTRLIVDIVARVPALGFIDVTRLLVFARPGRSSADGPNASCHCLQLPPSEPGYFFWRDRATGEMTRRTPWFVTKSPTVRLQGHEMHYLLSFALPRFADQSLRRSRKRVFYPQGTPDWVGKLDTVIHELYHIDPSQTCLRQFTTADGRVVDSLHHANYCEDVAGFVAEYLRSGPDFAVLAFLTEDFAALRGRAGAIAATTFSTFPSYPQHYREVVSHPALPADGQQPVLQPLAQPGRHAFDEHDLLLREFTGAGTRLVRRSARGALGTDKAA